MRPLVLLIVLLAQGVDASGMAIAQGSPARARSARVSDSYDPTTKRCGHEHDGPCEWARYWGKGNRKGRWVCLVWRRITQNGVDARRRARR